MVLRKSARETVPDEAMMAAAMLAACTAASATAPTWRWIMRRSETSASRKGQRREE